MMSGKQYCHHGECWAQRSGSENDLTKVRIETCKAERFHSGCVP